MEFQIIVNVVVAVAFSIFGWFARMMWRSVQDLQKEISEFRVHVAEKYAPKDEVRDALLRVEKMVGRIFDRLDEKADKT